MTDAHSRRMFLAGGLGTAALLRLNSLPALAQEAQDDLANLTLKEVSEQLRSGAVSSVAVTEACLARIEAYDPLLNAFITVARDDALRTARELDAEQRRGMRRGPLHGVPIALKDNIDTAGLRTTGASELFEDRVPDEDAAVAQRLKKAGAVLLGKLNLHEFAYGGSSTVTHFGTMHNPWNLDHVTGGSSGGPAAAVAARLCYGALGTDTAGSVRMPAAHCGIVGLKPTYGRVSTRGVITLSWTLDHVGPMCRTVEDAAMMLNAIAGYDEHEPTAADRPVPDFTRTLGESTAALRLGVPRRGFYDGLDPNVERAVGIALDTLRGLTASAVDIRLPEWGSPPTIWSAEAYAYHARWIAAAPEKYQPSTREKLTGAADAVAWKYAAARREVDVLRQSIDRLFDNVDLLVLPTMKAPPERLDARGPGGGNNTVAFDVFGLPAVSIPCGFTAAGLPMGVQIVGHHFDESTVLTLAHAYEQSTDWHKRRPPLR